MLLTSFSFPILNKDKSGGRRESLRKSSRIFQRAAASPLDKDIKPPRGPDLSSFAFLFVSLQFRSVHSGSIFLKQGSWADSDKIGGFQQLIEDLRIDMPLTSLHYSDRVFLLLKKSNPILSSTPARTIGQ